jgi:branched-chain amino acid aminotransferase
VAQPAIVDGVLTDADRATVPATDEGLLRGDGVFEVIRLYGGRPFALADHLRRLEGSARALRLALDAEAAAADVAALCAAAGGQDLALRYLVTRGGRRIGLLEQLRARNDAVTLGTVTYAPVRVLDGVKSLSYAANMLAGRLAREAGAHEALLVTPHGRVLEGATSAIFVVLADGTLATPPLEDHVLDSITRRRLVGLLEVDERPIARDELRAAREAFLASTLRDVQAVAAVDGEALPAAPGPVTAHAAEAFAAHVRAELGA